MPELPVIGDVEHFGHFGHFGPFEAFEAVDRSRADAE
jgi:hypothetical protein